MDFEHVPWTTLLGQTIQEMQKANAPEKQITAVKNDLIIAIQAIRHVRRCYEKLPHDK